MFQLPEKSEKCNSNFEVVLIYQTRSTNLDTISLAQFNFNPLTLNDHEYASQVGTFVPKNGGQNWFYDNLKLEAVRDYFKLDLQIQANRVKFADHDGLGNEWRSVESNHNKDTPSWITLRNLLNLCSKHAIQDEVYFTNAVEGNHRKLALDGVCLAAAAT